jgi:diguanylate cyclase (GGDEF)-like protein
MDSYRDPFPVDRDPFGASGEPFGPGGVSPDDVPALRDDLAQPDDVAEPQVLDLPGGSVDAVPIEADSLPPPTGWTDTRTGVDGPRLWDRLIISESARVRRYKRPATVVLVEIAGLEAVASLWGARTAETTLTVAARALAQEIRTSDHISRLDASRFGILLTETTEIAAINFVERARASCELQLQRGEGALGIAFGWASPPQDGDLSDALTLATERLAAEMADLLS